MKTVRMWQQVQSDAWHGRVNHNKHNLSGLRWHQVVKGWSQASESGVVLLGFVSNAGVLRNHGRSGTDGGPNAIRRILANFAWHQADTFYDAGDIVAEGHNLEAAQQRLAEVVTQLLDCGQRPIILGGGQEMAWGSYNGLVAWLEHVQSGALRRQTAAQLQAVTKSEKEFKEKLKKEYKVGIINFDAHFDLDTDNEASSGTPFYQIAQYCLDKRWPFNYLVLGIAEHSNTQDCFQRAEQLGVRYRLDQHMTWSQLESCRAQCQAFMDQVDFLYLSIDLDVFSGALAPGVSVPTVRGVGLDVIEILLDDIKRSGKLVLMDVAEMNPEYDSDHKTAALGAHLVYLLMREIQKHECNDECNE